MYVTLLRMNGMCMSVCVLNLYSVVAKQNMSNCLLHFFIFQSTEIAIQYKIIPIHYFVH